MNLGAPIETGNTAKIYLFDNKIIKIFNDNLPATESSYEAAKQKHAYSYGLSVPEVFDVKKINGKQAIIMEYIQGRTMGEILSENRNQMEYLMNLSVDIQLKVHMIVENSLEPMTEKLTRQIKSVQQLDQKYKVALLDKLDSMTFEKRLCHGDFHLYNLIMAENDVAIIDWVDSSAGDIRADVYRTYLLYSQFSMELAEMYVRLYCEKSGLSFNDIFQWAPIIAGARLAEHVPSENSERLIEIAHQFCRI